MDEIKLDYKEPALDPVKPVQRLEDINGTFPYLTAAPTHTPRNFREQIVLAKIAGTYYFYIYILELASWKRVAIA